MNRIALHVHTEYSFDCQTKLEDIIQFCRKNDISHVLISDHDCIDGALRLKKLCKEHNLQVIVGEEVTTCEGIHIIGVNLKRLIRSLKAPLVIEEVLEQGGLLYFPHPTRKDGVFSLNNWDEILNGKSFLIETYNNKLSAEQNEYMCRIVDENLASINSNHVKVEGTDAHYKKDIASTILCVEREDFHDGLFIHSFDGEYIREKKKSRVIIRIYYRLNLNQFIPPYLKNKLKIWYAYILG